MTIKTDTRISIGFNLREDAIKYIINYLILPALNVGCFFASSFLIKRYNSLCAHVFPSRTEREGVLKLV